ncbi:hypothetical protein S83_035684, partial [Arachis hypogaea]
PAWKEACATLQKLLSGTSCNLNLFFSFTLFPHSNSLNATLSLPFNPKPHFSVTCSASSS